MKDIEIMTEEEKRKYIFEDTRFEGRPRVNWISNCLLGDIRTFLDGLQNRIREKHDGKYFSDGFGNLSVPILISTALEFVAALCVGKTEAMEKDKKALFSINKDLEEEFEDGKSVSKKLKGIFEEKGYQLSTHAYFKKKNTVWKIVDNGDIDNKDIYYFKEENNKLDVLIDKYNATENTKKFVGRYFPEKYKEIPLLLQDGIRNGLVHTFSPKPFEYNGSYIRFQFYVEDRNIPSYIEKVNNTILIKINVFELFRVLEKAVEVYFAELETSTVLQEKFFRAWSSIESYKRVIISDQKEKSKEAELLFTYLNSNSSKRLLKD
ncbi:MAG: hypothetical protein KAT65_28135 [Methanophagales archaeon]|nr:hypothetical protein [Methanophagales archaeon]